MTLSEKLKQLRTQNALSQEKLAELVGVSRQAVTKWEAGQSLPSSANLIVLANIFHVSLDELTDNSAPPPNVSPEILHRNLTTLSIIVQAAMLNVVVQPFPPTEDEGFDHFFFLFRLALLALATTWMASNHRYEHDMVQQGKNRKIELLYCLLQGAAAWSLRTAEMYSVATVLILVIAFVYVVVINPKYMNRPLVKRKAKK